MAGRPRDPTRSRRRTGHRPKPDEAPKVRVLPALPSEGPTPPADLEPEVREAWDSIVSALHGITSLRPADGFVLEAFARQYVRMRQIGRICAAQEAGGYGVIGRKANGEVTVSPFVRGEREAAAAVLRFAETYGMTVAARMRLGLMQLQGRTMAESLSDDLNE